MTTRTPHHATSRRFSFAFALTALIAIALAAIPAPCQTPPQPAAAPQAATTLTPPQFFEVASVRLNPSTECCTTWTTIYPANRFTASRISLELLTAIAYEGISSKNISGGPSWFESQGYDISAKVEGDAGLTREQMQPLLQNLLKDRFHLIAHREQKLVSGYALVVAKGGLKLHPDALQPSKKAEDTGKNDEQPHGQILPNELRGWKMNLAGLAWLLESPAGGHVVDKTGITGDYDIKLSYATTRSPDSNLPDIFTALQEQLGLKLVPQKVSVETLVIDHVDKIPTEN
jgi:uncharacterized protein (TIGR03435 family)